MGCGIVSYTFNDPFHMLMLKSNEYDQSHRQFSNSTHCKEPSLGKSAWYSEPGQCARGQRRSLERGACSYVMQIQLCFPNHLSGDSQNPF